MLISTTLIAEFFHYLKLDWQSGESGNEYNSIIQVKWCKYL